MPAYTDPRRVSPPSLTAFKVLALSACAGLVLLIITWIVSLGADSPTFADVLGNKDSQQAFLSSKARELSIKAASRMASYTRPAIFQPPKPRMSNVT